MIYSPASGEKHNLGNSNHYRMKQNLGMFVITRGRFTIYPLPTVVYLTLLYSGQATLGHIRGTYIFPLNHGSQFR